MLPLRIYKYKGELNSNSRVLYIKKKITTQIKTRLLSMGRIDSLIIGESHIIRKDRVRSLNQKH